MEQVEKTQNVKELKFKETIKENDTRAKEMLEKLMQDPTYIDSLTDEDLLGIKDSHDPYNLPEVSDKRFVNLSITNFKDKYLRQFLTTALIGYMYRLCSEYEPIMDETTPEESRKKTAIRDRAIIEEFLNRNFNFNVDRHVRSSKKETLTNGELKNLAVEVVKQANEKEELLPEKSKIINDCKTVYTTAENLLVAAKKASSLMIEASKQLSEFGVDCTALDDASSIMLKKAVEMQTIRDQYAKNISSDTAKHIQWAFRRVPPADVYYHFNRYIDNHYDEYRKCVSELYSETPDIELAVVYYSPEHKTAAEAEEMRRKYQNDFKMEVYTIENRGVTLLGPFKENKEKIDYYNKNTEILRQMMNKNESDMKIGTDIMEKKVKIKKQENINRYGPDAKGLTQYSNTMGGGTGMKQALTPEEKKKMEEEYEKRKQKLGIKEVDEKDSIEVNVIHHKYDDDGTSTTKLSKFHSEVVLPTSGEKK